MFKVVNKVLGKKVVMNRFDEKNVYIYIYIYIYELSREFVPHALLFSRLCCKMMMMSTVLKQRKIWSFLIYIVWSCTIDVSDGKIPSQAEAYAERLNLKKNDVGSYFDEIYVSELEITNLPERFQGGKRYLASSIYNMYVRDDDLDPKDPRQAGFPLHRLASDETWDIYDGDGAIELYLFDLERKNMTQISLGRIKDGRTTVPHFVVPALTWIGALLSNNTTWALTGSTNVPGFDPRDSAMAADNQTLVHELRSTFPKHVALIDRLTSF